MGQTTTSNANIPDPNRRVMARMPLFNVGTPEAPAALPAKLSPGVNYRMAAPKMPTTGYNVFDTTTPEGKMFANMPLNFRDGGDAGAKKAALDKVKQFLIDMDINPMDIAMMIPKTTVMGLGMYPSEVADSTLEAYYARQLEDERRKKPVGRAEGSPPEGEMSAVPSIDRFGNFIADPVQPEPKRSLGEKAVGVAETALTLGTGTVLSPLNVITQAIQRGIDRARGKAVPDKNWEPDLSRGVPMPKTPAGQEMLQNVGRFMQDTKLDAALPQTQLMRTRVGPQAAKYTTEAVKNIAKSVDDSIPPMSPPMTPAMAGAATGPRVSTPPAAPVRDISEQSKGIMDIAKPMEATRPKGSVMRTEELKDAFEFDFDAFLVKNEDRYKDIPASQQKAAFDFIDTKLMDYFRKDYGTPDDPLRNLFLQNKTTIDKKISGNADLQSEASKKILADPNQSAEAKRDAMIYLSSTYDIVTPVDQLFLESKFPTRQDVMEASRRNVDKMRSQNALTTKEPESRSYVAKDQLSNFSPIEQRALQQGEILYTRAPIGFSDKDARLPFDRQSLYEHLMTVPPERLRDPTYTLEQALRDSEKNYKLIKDPKRIAKRINNGQQTTPEQKFTETQYLSNVPTAKENVGWFQLPTVNSLLIEGRLLKHCLSWNEEYQTKLLDGRSQFFSLRDKKGNAITSVELERDSNGDYSVVKQIKSRFNARVPDVYANDVEKFIGDLAAKYGPNRVVVKERLLPKNLEDYVTSTVTYDPDPPAQ